MVQRHLFVVFLFIAICVAPCYGILPTAVAEAQAATVSDGFESGNFSKLPWVTGGAANWVVNAGIHAAESPALITQDDFSYLQTALVTEPGIISFTYKVSSLDESHVLNFYIDGELQQSSWTGDLSWSEANYTIQTAGYHTFKWEFLKKFNSDLLNKVWIDDVVLSNALLPTYTINASATGGNGTISCNPSVTHGFNASCSITPEPGYHLETLVDNGNDVWFRSLGRTYAIPTVSADHTIVGTFSNIADNIESFETRNLRKFPWSTGGMNDGLNNVDVPGWSVTLSGSGGGYAAETPLLGNLQTSYLETKLFLPTAGDVTFSFKVSSEDQADFLNFYIDGTPVVEDRLWSGEMAWQQYTSQVPAGLHTFRWAYTTDSDTVMGANRAWIDDITFPVGVVPLFTDATDIEPFETGDFSRFPWSPGGDANWNVSTPGYQSFFAAESGVIGPDQKSSIETKLYIPADGNLTFSYKVSSENSPVGGDFLRFYIDDMVIAKGEWSGEIDWSKASFPVLAGNHLFRWEYSKDSEISIGQDKVWIDDIVFPGVIYKPSYTINAYVIGDMGGLGGTIDSCPSTVTHGAPLICIFSAAADYHLASVIDNSKSMPLPLGEYTIDPVLNDHTIAVTFASNSDVEDFETGNLSKFPWYPVTLWNVNNSSRYSGGYAVQAPLNLLDGGESTLQTTLSVPADCTMTFMYRMSSIAGGSTLKFLIDDAPPLSQSPSTWSTESPWAKASYQISAGIHSFKWQYSKEFTVGGEVDSAWIDDIIIPGATIVDLPVMLVSGGNVVFKLTLQDAYDATVSNDEIRLKAGASAGGLLANKDVAVTIKGGYDDAFTTISSKTSIGKTTINAGTVRMFDIAVQ